MNFGDLKIFLSEWLGLDKDALHVHAALLLYLVALFALRRSPRSIFPWLVVLGFEVANEAYDLWQQQFDGEPPRPAESLKDFWNTMLWPTVLLLVARWYVRRESAPVPPPPAEDCNALASPTETAEHASRDTDLPYHHRPTQVAPSDAEAFPGGDPGAPA